MKSSVRLALVAAMLALAGACSHMPELPQLPGLNSAPQATPNLAPRERVRLAVDLLGQGDVRRAEAELHAALEEQPNNAAARRLLQQITDEPRVVLGETARPYTVRQGETMAALAERFLGDPLMFYALARYNGIEAPNQLGAGQRLLIPVRPGVVTASAPQPNSTPPPVAPVIAPAPGADPARANQLRLQGLQQLNAGNVDGAITLLRQAQGLDANNPAIQRDLDRALRLQSGLASRG